MSWIPCTQPPKSPHQWGDWSCKSDLVQIKMVDGRETVGFYGKVVVGSATFWFIFDQEDEVFEDTLVGWKPIPKWIPVDAGLPTKEAEYLVTHSNGCVRFLRFIDSDWSDEDGYGAPAVVAYMEIPEYEPPTPA